MPENRGKEKHKMKQIECKPDKCRSISRGFNSWKLNGFKMNIDELLLKECRMSFKHSKQSSFKGSKRHKHKLFTCNRKSKHVLKLQHMIRHVLLKTLPELLRRLQRLLHKHKLKL